MVDSKGKMLAIALGALALFVGGVGVAAAGAGVSTPETLSAGHDAIRIAVPGMEILCTGPPGTCGGG
jgi:hypothetical protein